MCSEASVLPGAIDTLRVEAAEALNGPCVQEGWAPRVGGSSAPAAATAGDDPGGAGEAWQVCCAREAAGPALDSEAVAATAHGGSCLSSYSFLAVCATATSRSVATTGSMRTRFSERHSTLMEILGFDFEGSAGCFGVCGYTLLICLALCCISALNIAAWSSMGWGDVTLPYLVKNGYKWYLYPFSGCAFIVLILYLLDFFLPPHMPGQFCKLWETDCCVGRSLLCLASLLFAAGCLMMERKYSFIPMLMTLVLQPVFVLVVAIILRPGSHKVRNVQDPTAQPRAKRVADAVDKLDEEAKDRLLCNIDTRTKILEGLSREEKDVLNFLKASLFAFLVGFVGTLAAWIVWALVWNRGLEKLDDRGADTELVYLLWLTPLVVAFGNLVFGLFMMFRLLMQSAYSDTDDFRRKLKETTKQDEQANKYTPSTWTDKSIKNEKLKRVTMVVKLICVTLIVFMGISYISGLFVSTGGRQMAGLTMGLFGAFFLSFIVFVYVSLTRVAKAMGAEVKKLPMFKAMLALRHSDWIRALMFCIFLPLLPCIFFLSVCNQIVRKCRGKSIAANFRCYASTQGAQAWENTIAIELKAAERDGCLTPRVQALLKSTQSWDKLSIISKLYAWCALFNMLYVFPIFFNLFCSSLGGYLKSVHFAIVLSVVFAVGVFLFLLPPVPGATIYLFGGAIVADTCPSSLGGFWGGAVINIFLCFILKLTACAIQQKLIGEQLGRKVWVRQLVGIHTTQIRCIEKVLRVPGLTLGKVAILCGGPDWPTSVLAGILRLSLVQCELGTTPIIFFVAPFSLTGSAYVKMGAPISVSTEDATDAELDEMHRQQMWNSVAKLLMLASGMFTLVLAAIIGWAMQNTLEAHHKELSHNLPDNVELHWLDYRTEQLRIGSDVTWKQVPTFFKSMCVFGATIQIMSCQVIWWKFSTLFGSFRVSDDIETLRIYGKPPDAVFSFGALLCMSAYVFGWVIFLVFQHWRRQTTRKKNAEIDRDLAESAAKWKDDWVKKTRDEWEAFIEGGGASAGGAAAVGDAAGESEFAASAVLAAAVWPNSPTP